MQGGNLADLGGPVLMQEEIWASSDPSEFGQVDVVFMCMKKWQLEEAAAMLPPLLGRDTVVIPLQNGVDSHEVLSGVVPGKRVLMGTTRMVSLAEKPGVIVHTGPASFAIGEFETDQVDRVARIVSLFKTVPAMEAYAPEDMHLELWKKFCFITATSGICAVTRCPILTWAGVEETLLLYKECIEELTSLAKKRGVRFPDEAVLELVAFPKTIWCPEIVTSMARDVMNGTQSELDDLLGSTIRLAREEGLPAPVTSLIYSALLPQELRARGAINYHINGVHGV